MASVTKKARQDQPRGEISMHAVTAAVETEANLEVSRSAPGLLQLRSTVSSASPLLSLEDLDILLPLALWCVSPHTWANLVLGAATCIVLTDAPSGTVEVRSHM